MATLVEKPAGLCAFYDGLLDDDPEMVHGEGVINEQLKVNRPPQQAIKLESIIMQRRRSVLAVRNEAAVIEARDEAVPLWNAHLRLRCHRFGKGHRLGRAYRFDGQSRLSAVATPITLFASVLTKNPIVATISYPAFDRRIL